MIRSWLTARPARLAACVAAVVGAMLAQGCGGERTASSRFYILTPLPPPAATGAGAGGDPITIGVGPVRLPAYLDRAQIVTRRGADEIDVAEFDRWGEPLSDGVPRTIANDLAALRPADNVALFPWPAGRPVRYHVLVDVSRFEGAPGGDVVLDARWRIMGDDRKELVARRSVVTEAVGGSGYPAIAAAMSRALATLSRQIAAAVGSL